MYVDINLSYVHMHICSHVKLSHTDVANVQIDLPYICTTLSLKAVMYNIVQNHDIMSIRPLFTLY